MVVFDIDDACQNYKEKVQLDPAVVSSASQTPAASVLGGQDARETPSNSASKERTNGGMKKTRSWLWKYWQLKVVQLSLSLYIAIMSYAPVGTFGIYGGFVDPSTGYIIDAASEENTDAGVIDTRGAFRAIVATNWLQMACIGITRVTAFFMYPALILVFITKFRFTMARLSQTPFALWLFQDLHELHVYCGWTIAVDGILHTTFHIIRWADQGNLRLVFDHWSGRSGFVICVSLAAVCVPMMFRSIKDRLSFEIRKGLHYLFIPFAIALCFHTTPTSIPNGGFTIYIFSTLIGYYFLDALLVNLFMSEEIKTTIFHVLPTGVQLTMAVSERFNGMGNEDGGYCVVCFPWVNKWQWHAFSLFENPHNPKERQIFLEKTGDWTSRVHELLQRDTVRPVWVKGPFPSPYSHATSYDNQIMVAGGIGITPALSVLRANKHTRRTNLIWSVRDPAMLEFFLEHTYLDHHGWNMIFYTGATPLLNSKIEALKGTNVCVIQGRPDLKSAIANIIYGVESEVGKPEMYIMNQRDEAIQTLYSKLEELDEDEEFTAADKVDILSELAAELGYLFSDLVIHAPEINRDSFQEPTESEWPTLRDADVLASFRIGGRAHSAHLSEGSVSERSVSHNSRESTRGSMRRRRRDMTSGIHKSIHKSIRKKRSEDLAVELAFKPWEKMEEADGFVKNLEPEVLASWGILYCGGAKAVEKILKQAANEYEVDFHTEAFAW